MARKTPSAVPAVPQKLGTQCAGNPECKFPGRLWVSTIRRDERLCVNHYYRALEANHSLIEDSTVPPREQPVDMKSRAAGE